MRQLEGITTHMKWSFSETHASFDYCQGPFQDTPNNGCRASTLSVLSTALQEGEHKWSNHEKHFRQWQSAAAVVDPQHPEASVEPRQQTKTTALHSAMLAEPSTRTSCQAQACIPDLFGIEFGKMQAPLKCECWAPREAVRRLP
eukprot:6472837-Amphidinium_carterae.1